MSTSELSDTHARARQPDGAPVLSIRDLDVSARGGHGLTIPLVRSVSFDVQPGEVVAVVGESGSGKSTVCHAVVGLLADNLNVVRGTIGFNGRDLASATDSELREIRGMEIGMVFQDPLASLNPVRKIGYQLTEPRILHNLDRRKSARRWALDTLASLGFKDPARTMASYPHMLSGGMRQRICVGIAYAAEPRLVIADEPTTALDVSLQGKLLRLLLEYAERHHSAILLVSHDIGVVRAVAQHVVVMYGGRVLEHGPTAQVLNQPRQPYTRALLDALPTLAPESRGQDLAAIAADTTPDSASSGCPFVSRCPHAIERCAVQFPDATTNGQHTFWCWNPGGEEVGQ